MILDSASAEVTAQAVDPRQRGGHAGQSGCGGNRPSPSRRYVTGPALSPEGRGNIAAAFGAAAQPWRAGAAAVAAPTFGALSLAAVSRWRPPNSSSAALVRMRATPLNFGTSCAATTGN